MKERMLVKALEIVIAMAMKFLTPDRVKAWISIMLDNLEELVDRSDPKWDDIIFKPQIQLVRNLLDLEDDE
jgi:hypothetical protein